MDYMKIKEIKYLKNIEDVNKALKENWLLMLITTNKDNGIEYLIGRIWFWKAKNITINLWGIVTSLIRIYSE